MKNRKGFTLVELVIVIAVIAILAAVLIPTFGGIISKANESAAMQEARNAYTMYLSKVAEAGAVLDDLEVKLGTEKYVKITDGKVVETSGQYTYKTAAGPDILEVVNGKVKVTCSCPKVEDATENPHTFAQK